MEHDPVSLTPEEMMAVERHYEAHVGPLASQVLDEIVSTDIHLDVLFMPSTGDRPFLVIGTMGMSARRMTAPRGQAPLLELAMPLPPAWPIEPLLRGETQIGEEVYWPVRWLKNAARFPFERDTWLGPGHTIRPDNGGSLGPDSPFEALAILEPRPFRSGFGRLVDGTREIRFLMLAPLFAAEWELKRERGWDVVEQRLLAIPPERWAEPDRPSIAGGQRHNYS